MKISTCVHQFFEQYLPRIKGSSPQTIKAYRDTFTLFLPFAANYHGIKVNSLKMGHLNSELILAFLDHLESDRGNTPRTRNNRLAALKSMAKMIRFMYPEKRKLAERILNIPQKRTQKQLIGFLYQGEIDSILKTVNITKKEGFRDYTMLHLLYDSGARASELASLNIADFDYQQEMLAILGKGNRYRLISLLPKTTELIRLYITKYRQIPHPLYKQRLFINQRKTEFSRHGINAICKKYQKKALSPKRLQYINPAHSFRHSCAVRMLSLGNSIAEIKNHLGHNNAESTMTYLHMDLVRKREIQKQFLEYAQSMIADDPKIDELLDWENKKDILTWLDSL